MVRFVTPWTRSLGAGLVALGAIASSACRKPSGPPVVVATTAPLADLVQRVAGADAVVVKLVSQGSAAREAPADVEAKLAGVRLAVRVGVGFDDWLDALAKAANPKARSLAIADRVPTRTSTLPARAAGGEADGHEDPARIDPYVWLDPQGMRLAAKAVGEELARADAAHASAYRFRAGELDEVLRKLDEASEAKLVECKAPPIVADAPVLGYFAERYRISVVTVLRPFGGPATAAWLASVKAAVAELPAVALLATGSEIPEEMKGLGRPVSHVPVLDLPVDVAVRTLVEALCAAGKSSAPVPPAPARP
jgi:ABC-type Zn uptake system ZnuABC Zn-binding protein ZnuA